MLVLKVLREERKSKALPSVVAWCDLTLLQLEYWKRAARTTSRRMENSLIVIICNNCRSSQCRELSSGGLTGQD